MTEQASESADFSWMHRTYSEIKHCAQRSGSVLIVPVGSTEQHGHHLPTGTDTILAESITHGAVERTSELGLPVLITPSVWAGNSPHHCSFGGTVSLPPEKLTQQLDSIAESVLDNGFDALVFVNGHGGNEGIISTAVSSIGADHADAQILGLTYFKLIKEFADEIRDSEIGGVSHGGEFETSMMLHLRPELVRTELIEGTMRDEPYRQARQDLFDDGPLSVYRPFTEYSESGAIGDPVSATEQKGKKLYKRFCEELATLLIEIHEENK